jgi:hypothetical protein
MIDKQPASPTARSSGSVRSLQGPLVAFLMHRLINPVMRWGLAGPLHAHFGSDTLMVLSFIGRRSGKRYRFPIGYVRQGSTLLSYSPFSWWRSLSGGAPVTVTLRGRVIQGRAEAITDTAIVEPGMLLYVRHNPGDAKYFDVKIGPDGEPDAADVASAAQRNVQLRIELEDTEHGA